ncbi:hypothetical protein JCM10296v2_006094 [Rhodotorula toruloides]
MSHDSSYVFRGKCMLRCPPETQSRSSQADPKALSDPSGAHSATPASPRLPHELICLVIEFCNDFKHGREATLAALCCLGKAYTSTAQRTLYRKI